ncbi:MAG: hypothetical protein QNK18_16310 [Gammaproteobacteria bacterium]|nr:hypothetical protein [Gammaproteobacteria bacterium]
MKHIPDFTDTELWIIRSTVKERYGRKVSVELAETEIRARPGAKELAVSPAVYWEEGGVHFVVFKMGDSRYRCQFFYRLHQMFGTDIEEFEDLGECVISLLQVQADHAAQAQGQDPQDNPKRGNRQKWPRTPFMPSPVVSPPSSTPVPAASSRRPAATPTK